jgi:hypothetical protein
MCRYISVTYVSGVYHGDDSTGGGGAGFNVLGELRDCTGRVAFLWRLGGQCNGSYFGFCHLILLLGFEFS